MNRFGARRAIISRPAVDVIPAGALGVWYADQYSASPPTVPNEITKAATPPSANILGASRRAFAQGMYWNKNSATATDTGDTAPDGSASASTLSGTGNWWLRCDPILTAGTYTFAFNAKRNAGSDQQFIIDFFTAGSSSGVLTATSAWQRFSFTATVGAGAQTILAPMSKDGSTAADLFICDVELYAGASDLGPQSYAGHLYLGGNNISSAGTEAPSYASGALDFSAANCFGLTSFSTAQSLGSATAMALVSKTAAGSSNQTFFSKLGAHTSFSAMTEINETPAIYFNGGATQPNDIAGLWPLLSKGYHLITCRVNGTTLDIFLDDFKLFGATITAGSPSVADALVGSLAGGFAAGWKLSAMALYGSALADAEVRTACSVLQARAALSSITATPQSRIYVAEGDSITAGFGGFSPYSYLFGPNASPAVLGEVNAVSGSTLATMSARAARLDAILPPNKGGRKAILSVLIGVNDLGGYSSAAQYITDLAAYCDARRTAGWLVVICTILPSTNANVNTRRATVNAAITGSWLGVHCDAISDFAADATIGPDAAASDAAKYSDGVHPTSATQVTMETILRPAVNGL